MGFDKDLQYFVNSEKKWFTPGDCKNYLLDDPILDWLEKYGKYNNLTPVYSHKKEFDDFLKKQYSEFYKFITFKLEDSSKITKIGEKIDLNKKILHTIKGFEKGSEIIINGCLYNINNLTYGYPCILIRSDIFLKKYPYLIDFDYNFKRGCKFNTNWHYLIVDISLLTIIFSKKNKNEIGNSSKQFFTIKSKLYLLNKALENIQNYLPKITFIIGRKYFNYEKKKQYNPLEKIGIISFKKNRNVEKKTLLALQWLNKLERNGKKWDVSNTNLYPNMCNITNNPWNFVKKEIAKKNSEITMLWGCGIKQRNIALKKNINSWKDIECNAEMLGLRGKKKKIVEGLLNINKFNNNILINPRRIKNYKNLKLIEVNTLEFFVDFETVNNLNEDFFSELNDSEPMLFMIGCITKINNNKTNTIEYIEFTVNKLDKSEELDILINWLSYMEILKKKYSCYNPKIYHWSHAEKIHYLNAQKYHKNEKLISLNFIDILEIFKNEPITLKDTFTYGLKEIAKTMYKFKMIKTIWDDNDIDGKEAMIFAWISNKMVKKYKDSIQNNQLIKDIKKYNYFDCKVLEEIMSYLRINLM